MATISQPVPEVEPCDDGTPPPLPGRMLTFDEFLEWCRGYEKARVEWVDGEVVVISPVSFDHTNLNEFLGAVLRFFVDHHDLGLVLGPEFLCRFRDPGRDVARVPDLLFVATARSPSIQRTYLDGFPDLVVEIVSPDSSSRDYREKYMDYQAGGVREYWVVNPLSKHLEAWALDAESGKFRPIVETDGRFLSAVLPGFFLRTEWLWREPLPKLREVLRALGVL